jgi:hypothetical protein
MENQKSKKGLSSGDIIALLAFLVSGFSVWFSIYQYKQQKVDSAKQDSINAQRFEMQFRQIRCNDSSQIAISIENLKNSKESFKTQLKQIRTSDSIKRIFDSIQITVSLQNLKNSVKPLITIDRVAAPIEANDFGILIKNEGVGPAIFDKIVIKFDGKINTLENIERFAESINLNCFRGSWMWFSVEKNLVVRNGNNFWLFKIPRENVSNLRLLDSLINKHVSIKVQYHSITDDLNSAGN